MRKYVILAALIFATPLFVANASAADLTRDTYLGTTLKEVQANLTGMGYQVRETEREDGKIEVDFVKNGTKGEVYVSTATGKVTKLEFE